MLENVRIQKIKENSVVIHGPTLIIRSNIRKI